MTGTEHAEINRWLGRTWEVRATTDHQVFLILDGGTPVMSVDTARQLARALLDAAIVADNTKPKTPPGAT